jgi:Domain of unknown function (DUF3384)/Rap/ran-GAP/Tuberin
MLLGAFQRLTSRSQPALDVNPTVAVSQNGSASHNQSPSLDIGNGTSPTAASDSNTLPPYSESSFPVVGGPPDIKELISKLTPDKTIQLRIAAANQIIAVLHKYPIKDVLPIWTAGRDLLQQPDEASQTGLMLLASCIKAASPSPMTRSIFWNSLLSYKGDKLLEVRLQAVSDISSNGNYIEGLEDGISKYLCRLLKSAFKEAGYARRRVLKQEESIDNLEEITLQKAFHLIDQLLKSNSPFLADADFSIIMDQLGYICKRTTSTVDIKNATDIMGTIACYAQITPEAFRPCLNLLCNIYKHLDSIQSHTWSVFRAVFNSPMKTDVMDMLFHILQSPSGKQVLVEVQGALAVLRDLAKNNGLGGLPSVPLSILSPAVNNALRGSSMVSLALDALDFYKVVVTTPTLWSSLFEDADWTNFRETVEKAASLLVLSIPPEVSLEKGENLGKDAEAGILALNTITDGLCKDFATLHVLQQEEAVKLFFKLGTLLSDAVVTTLLSYLATKPYLASPANANHREIWSQLFHNFANNPVRPPAIRCQTLDQLSVMYEGIQYLPANDVVDFVNLFMQNLSLDQSVDVLETVAHFFCKALSGIHRDLLFESIMEEVQSTVFSRYPTDSASPQARYPFSSSASVDHDQPSACRVIVRHVIRLFLNLINESAKHAEVLYKFILDVAGSQACEADARICALKLMFRIRCTGDYRIYIAPVSESETIAAVLCRTEDTAKAPMQLEDGLDKELRVASSGSGSRPKSANIRRPIPPLWFYPGPKGLPQEPPKQPSLVVYASTPELVPKTGQYAVLKLTLWLETVISLLQQPNIDWEIYSYVLVHLGAQLKNTSLFASAVPHIRLLRSFLRDQIQGASFHDPPAHTSLRKADVAVCVYHILTMLISYHPHFAKSEDDDMVKCFMLGIGSWDGTSKWCIHALSICCHELPLSVSKSLDGILMKMSQIITQPQIAIHILEFLCGLVRLPEVFKNFREEQYKSVFGISFRYLQFVRDQRQRADDSKSLTTPSKSMKRQSDSIRELKGSDPEFRSKARPEELPQYVYSLAFHVITFWFMALKMRDRSLYMRWIVKNLTYTDSYGDHMIEDQGLVTMDMMDRIAYSDRDDTIYNASFAQEQDGEVSKKTWICGMSLLTVETAGRSGLSQLTRRRPSGTRYTIYRPSLTSPPRHQVPLSYGLDADAFYTSSYTGVLPEDVLQDLYSSTSLAALPAAQAEMPVLLPDDPAIDRTLRTFDLNSVVDGHKIGIIYIGEGQTDEASILANTSGSPAYAEFVSQLGTLIRLKGSKMNTQGLDRNDDSDGKYAICWRDRATEVVFHTTTMMPTNLESDPLCIYKKRHIGNSFVNIIWNDSGLDFKFDTFPSAFNYVYIVLTPESRADFVAQRMASTAPHTEPNGEYHPSPHTNPNTNPNTTTTSPIFPPLPGAPFAISSLNLAAQETSSAHSRAWEAPNLSRLTYKLQVLSAPGFPAISPAAETKMVTAKSLAPLVRALALNASFFSLVWSSRPANGQLQPGDEFDSVVSPWRNRLKEIRKLREKHTPDTHGHGPSASMSSGAGRSSPAHHNQNGGALGGAFLGNARCSGIVSQRVSLGFGGLGGGGE